MWKSTSRAFRICMAKGGRDSWRPSYSRPKLTLFSRKRRSWGAALKKITRPPENFLCQILARDQLCQEFWDLVPITGALIMKRSTEHALVVLVWWWLFWTSAALRPASLFVKKLLIDYSVFSLSCTTSLIAGSLERDIKHALLYPPSTQTHMYTFLQNNECSWFFLYERWLLESREKAAVVSVFV